MTDPTPRDTALRRLLNERRRELQQDGAGRLRDERAGRAGDVIDDLEQTDAASQEELALRLLQIRTETVARIDQALLRLAAGEYGSCLNCDREIAEPRLRAMPYAVRCQACQHRREREERDERRSARQPSDPVIFSGAAR